MEKRIAMFLAAAMAAVCVSAEPTVTDVTAKQRYPWNGLVDIDCMVSGIEEAANGYKFVVVAVDKDTGKEYTATHFTAKHVDVTAEHGGMSVHEGGVSENGRYELLWDARTDMGQVVVERMAMRVTLEMAGVSSGKVQLWEGGPYWADRNIGASSPEDYGLYFWWGDTTGHRPSLDGTFRFSFEPSNCPTYNKSEWELQSAGWITSAGVLAPSHDAAHVKWGEAWRMPTRQELSDLNSKCDWGWKTTNGVNGYVVRGRGEYASNSIFLPCAGRGYGTSFDDSDSYSHYWSSVPSSVPYSDGYYSIDLLFCSSYHSSSSINRWIGCSVRPVQGGTN